MVDDFAAEAAAEARRKTQAAERLAGIQADKAVRLRQSAQTALGQIRSLCAEAAKTLESAGIEPWPKPTRWERLTRSGPTRHWSAGGFNFDALGRFYIGSSAMETFEESCRGCEEQLVRDREVPLSFESHLVLSIERGIPEVYIPADYPYDGTPPSPLREHLVSAVAEQLRAV